MWRRGADTDGFVANFVESEQIIQLNGCTASFVQVDLFNIVMVILSTFYLVHMVLEYLIFIE